MSPGFQRRSPPKAPLHPVCYSDGPSYVRCRCDRSAPALSDAALRAPAPSAPLSVRPPTTAGAAAQLKLCTCLLKSVTRSLSAAFSPLHKTRHRPPFREGVLPLVQPFSSRSPAVAALMRSATVFQLRHVLFPRQYHPAQNPLSNKSRFRVHPHAAASLIAAGRRLHAAVPARTA